MLFLVLFCRQTLVFFFFVYIVGLGRSYRNTVTGAINDLLTVIIVVTIKTIFVTYIQVMNELGLGSSLFLFLYSGNLVEL